MIGFNLSAALLLFPLNLAKALDVPYRDKIFKVGDAVLPVPNAG